MKANMFNAKRLVRLLVALVLVIGMLPLHTPTAYAAAEPPTYDDSSYIDGQYRPAIFANGNDLIIEAGTNGTTSVYYMNNGVKSAVVENTDLSDAYIFAGYDSSSKSMTGDFTITMYGGNVNTIYAGHRSSGAVNGDVTIIMMENAQVQAVHPNSAAGTANFNGKLRLFAANGLSGVTISGRSFDGQIVKTSSGWSVTGDAVVPSGFTMNIAEGTTVTVASGATLTNEGSIVNNGTIHLQKSFTQLKGTEPTGSGSYIVNLPYVENASAVTAASVNCVATANPAYRVLGGKLYLDVPQGKIWAEIDGKEYYCDFNGEQTEMQSYTSVTDISVVRVSIKLVATAQPIDVLPQTFTYQITDAGTTGASVSDDSIVVPFSGTVGFSVTATDGYRSFTKNFNLSVNHVAVTGIANDSVIPTSAEPSSIALPTQVIPADATYKTIEWTVTGPAAISGSTLKLSDVGTVTLTATVKNGLVNGQDYTKTYTIAVSAPKTIDISFGNIIIKEASGGHTVTYYNQSGQQSQFYAADQLIIITGTTTENNITIESGSPNVVLKNCNIQLSDYPYQAIYVYSSAKSAEITLEGTNILKAAWAGIHVMGTRLTIDGNGSLTATGTEGPGIGSGVNSAPGTIIINGGTITATGGSGSAGIGSGGGWNSGEIIINGGNVTATGGDRAAGIGGGDRGTGTVTINGGTVTANGGELGAGIGSGTSGAGTVTINGGTVTANGGDHGAGIGGGNSGTGSVTIAGGTITATGGGDYGAGIGGGYYGTGTVTITGGTVTATGAKGAGIGGGYSGTGSVTITGGTVMATAADGAGIGGGYNKAGTVTINGGTITAVGATGAGIGGGYYKTGTVTINGGNISATSEYGEAVGSGYFASAGTVENDAKNNVTLYTITLNGAAANTAVTAVKDAQGNDIYGWTDVKTIDNKLYFYLPATSKVASVTAGGITYVCNRNGTFYASHSEFLEATCTAPKTCPDCGITQGEAKGHDWTDRNGICKNDASHTCDHTESTSTEVCSICTATLHIHDWTYKASGAAITATCSNADNKCPNTNGGTITIIADGKTYDGKAVGDLTSGSFAEGVPTLTTTYQYKATEDGEYGAGGDIKDAGFYKITVKAPDGQTSVSKEIEIKKLAVTVTAKDQSITYGGQIATGTAQVTVDTLAEGHYISSVTVSTDDVNVTESGTIQVSNAVIHDGNSRDVTANYDITYVDGKLTIAAKEMTAEASGHTGYYDGNAHTITVTPSETDATVKYGTAEGTYNLTTAPTYTNAGTYTVYYQVTKANYTTVTGNETVKIDPVEITVTVNEIADQPYTGSPITPAVTVTDKDGKLVGNDKLVEGTDYTVEYSTNNTNVGTVTVTIKDVTGGNYTVSGSGSFEIVQATNTWTTDPSIAGWTYGNTASTPQMGVAKFGTATVTYSGTANDGTVYTNSATAPDKAGSYKAVFTIAGTDNYSALTKEVPFNINKATYNMTAAKWDYTSAFQYDGKAHTVAVTGLPSGVTVKEYSGNSASVVGSYTAKVTFTYDEDNYNAPVLADLTWAIENNWNPTEYTTNGSGWQNTDFVITAKDGYKLSTTNTAEGDWVDSLTGTTEGENSIAFYVTNETTGAISLAVTVSYKLDKTAPTGTVSIDDNKWNELWNTITFGLFFKETKTVKVEVDADLSGIAKVEYYDSAVALTAEEVKAITTWTDMGTDYAQDVTAEDAKTFIYYIRITDNAGNVTYISTADGTFDLTAPAISGITNGSTYYTTQKVNVTDINLATVTLNGEAATGEITLAGNAEETYTIVATDKAGNETIYTVTMKPIASISAPIDSIDESNVTSADTDTIAEVEAAAAAVDTANATDEEKAAIKAITDKCDALQEVIADTAAEYERITDAIASYDPDKVTSADKADLDKLAEDLKALVESGNLTDTEKAALETPAANLNDMIETIIEVTAEADRIANAVGGYNLETVKSDHKDEIEQLIKDIDALLATDNLTNEERTALKGEKAKCENLLAKIEDTIALVDKLTEDVGAYDEDTVKSTDKAALEQLLEDIKAVIEGNTNITGEEKAELEALADTVEDLLAKIEEVADAPVTEDTVKVKDITSENVTPEDKEDLEKAKEDLEKALEDYGGNYTEDEKKAIEDEIKRIDDALEVIGNVEAAQGKINDLPDTITKQDEEAIEAADDAYNALTDYEKSLIDTDVKQKLDDAKAALAELIKPTELNSSANGNNFLWIVLLLIIVITVIILIVVGKKRKAAK